MSMHDPVLRDVKAHLLKLHEDSSKKPIVDFHPSLLSFCQSVEAAFRKGIRRSVTALGATKQDYWIWIYNLPLSTSHCSSWCRCSGVDEESSHYFPYSVPDKSKLIFKSVLETTKKNSKLRTVQGRGRYFIRLCLQKHILSIPVLLLLKNPDYRAKLFDPNTSLLGDDLLAEVLLSGLQEADVLEFNLDLQNCSFLDETWLLPLYRIHEFVPCSSLGVKIGYVKNRVMVVGVTDGSIASDDDLIEVGDILDELFGESLYDCKRSKIPQLMRRNRGVPIQVNIVKGHYLSGELFPPASIIMRQLSLNVDTLIQGFRKKALQKCYEEPLSMLDLNCDCTHDPISTSRDADLTSLGYPVFYLGNVSVGEDGSKDKITDGIAEVLKFSSHKMAVKFEIQETHLVIKETQSGKKLFDHCYTRIGACGRPKCPASYFAYTIGETTCNLAKEFFCYLFEANNPEMSREILLNIAKGFERTHWAV